MSTQLLIQVGGHYLCRNGYMAYVMAQTEDGNYVASLLDESGGPGLYGTAEYVSSGAMRGYKSSVYDLVQAVTREDYEARRRKPIKKSYWQRLWDKSQ